MKNLNLKSKTKPKAQPFKYTHSSGGLKNVLEPKLPKKKKVRVSKWNSAETIKRQLQGLA